MITKAYRLTDRAGPYIIGRPTALLPKGVDGSVTIDLTDEQASFHLASGEIEDVTPPADDPAPKASYKPASPKA